MAAPGDRLGGRYELIEPIGSGGMATVWRARDVRLRRTVAVKILRPQFAEDPEFVARFESEARHAASLAHPNVAAVYDTGFDPGPDGGTRYIVMELIDSATVAELIRAGPLGPIQAVDIAIAAARALAAAHRRGIVHRDVKPGNLLIGRDGRVRLADFGIARALATSRLTTAGEMFGSAPYMSPEQVRGQEALASSDIYSLGLVLYEMLRGRLPRPAGATPRAGPYEPDAPSGSAPIELTGLPAGLDRILARALQRDPADRYPSARMFAGALESAARRLRRDAGPQPAVATTTAGRLARRSRTRKGRPMFVAESPARGVAAGAPAPRAGDAPRAARAAAPALPEEGLDARGPAPIAAPGSASVTTRTGTVPTRSSRAGRRASSPARNSDRGKRPAAIPLLVGVAAIVAAFAIAVAVVNLGARSLGGVLAATGSPDLVGVGPAASPSVVLAPAASATASPSLATSPSASSRPAATTTPRPTRAPTPPPGPTPPTVAERPTAAVADFYDAVAEHDWDRAIARWTTSMQRRYPPDEWLIGRFSRTTRIDITSLRQVALDSGAGSATVAVSIVEYRTVEPSPRSFSGTWDLVRVGGRWLLNQPHF